MSASDVVSRTSYDQTVRIDPEINSKGFTSDEARARIEDAKFMACRPNYSRRRHSGSLLPWLLNGDSRSRKIRVASRHRDAPNPLRRCNCIRRSHGPGQDPRPCLSPYLLRTHVLVTTSVKKMTIDSKTYRVQPSTKVDPSKWPTIVDSYSKWNRSWEPELTPQMFG